MYCYFSGLLKGSITPTFDKMKTISKNLIVLLFIAVLTSCSQTKTLDEHEKAEISSEITDMFNDYHKDILDGGLLAEFKYLDESSDFFWVPPGYASALSYDSVKSILEVNHKLLQSADFSWESLQIFPLSNEIANYSGIVEGIMTDTSGLASNVRIIESGTVIKRSDGWKILNGQSAILQKKILLR